VVGAALTNMYSGDI